ncbi:MAG: peptidase P60 [Alphaproteobacteria bacterium]|nr:peptidase P60 [Alphaproteobacteria bacterium]
MTPRSAILAEARSWIGTPYRHQASVKGTGCDCLGLVRGVWRALYGEEPQPVPPYTPDWAEAQGAETLLDAATAHLVAADAPAPGDVLLFRMAQGAPMKHAAIFAERDRVIHAYWGRAVVESRYAPWWRTRCGAVFSFPGAAPWPS